MPRLHAAERVSVMRSRGSSTVQSLCSSAAQCFSNSLPTISADRTYTLADHSNHSRNDAIINSGRSGILKAFPHPLHGLGVMQ